MAGHRTEGVRNGELFTRTSSGLEKNMLNYMVSGVQQENIRYTTLQDSFVLHFNGDIS